MGRTGMRKGFEIYHNKKNAPENYREVGASQAESNQTPVELQNHSTFLDSSQITKETRLESYVQRPTPRQKEVLQVLQEHGEMVPRQIAAILGYYDPQLVRPQLTELKAAGRVEVVGKAMDEVTGKNVGVWRAR